MLDVQLEKILFLDIETVPLTKKYADLPPELAHLWDDKTQTLQNRNPALNSPEQTPEEIFARAGIYAEFGKVVCVSVGFVHYNDQKEMCFRTKSFVGEDEKQLLKEFSALLNKFISSREHTLCGHNIKEFDIPFLCRRMLINGLPLPPALRIAGKKPWEIHFLDTLELWKFGDYKSYTSLKLLTAIFGIPTPKDDIDGSQVAEVFYEERDLRRISVYCEKDVVATAQVFLRLLGKTLIAANNICSVGK